MSQQTMLATTTLVTITTIFTPGRVWSDNAGKVFDVKEPDA